jgi:tetratricopeptide (TPR) repeat protein
MKKAICAIVSICLMMMLFVTSCGQPPAPPPSDAPKSPEPQTSASQAASPAAASPVPSGSPVASATPSGEVSEFIRQGQSSLGLMKYEDAIASFTKAVNADKNNAEALTYRAETYWFLKMYKEGMSDVEAALKINPNFARAYAVRGTINNSENRYDEALADFDKAIKLDPKLTAAVLGKVNTLANLEKYKEALELLEKEKALMSDKLPALIQEAVIKEKMGEYDEAVKVYKQLIVMQPKNSRFHSMIGVCFVLTQQPGEAVEYFNKADQFLAEGVKNNAIPPAEAKKILKDIMSNKITAYSDAGMYDNVLTECEKYFKEFGEESTIRNNYAYAYYRLGKRADAEKNMKKWLEFKFASKPVFKSSGDYIDMGDAFYMLHENKKAEEAFRQAEKMSPSDPVIYFKLGALYLQMKDNKKAKTSLEKALSLPTATPKLSKIDIEYTKKLLNEVSK